MKKVFIIFCSGVILLINSGCPKPCIETNYSFNAKVHIVPDSDSVNVGDSIYIMSSFPTELTDQNTSLKIDYSGATSIGITLAVSQLIPDSSLATDAVANFEYFSKSGKIYNDRNIPSPNGVQQLTYEETNGSYELKIGLIPKKRGVYVLGIGNGLSVGRKNNRRCEKASFYTNLENTTQHFYLLYNWDPNAQFYGDGRNRVYYFKVY